MNSDSRREIAEGALHARGEALRVREESMKLRETTADAGEALAQTLTDRLVESALQTREANERLVIASMRSQALTEAAEQANALKDDFLAMLSHELRNPLAPIRNAAAILDHISHAEPRLPWIHGVIERQVEQMTRLLDDLLDVTRLRSGKIVLLKRSVLAREFIEQAIETCRPLAESRAQQLTVEFPAELIYVDGDPVRLTQVFANLLNNAVKYTGTGGAITVRVQVCEQALVVRVQDNGRGLSPESLSRVFELFMQEDRSLAHAQGGLGIGLTVVRRLVELHGGTVEAASAGLNHGSEFMVTLPLVQPPAPAPAEMPAPPAPPQALRIVVIEDNVDANDSLSALLTLVGHDVRSAYDGISGIALVRASRPQVVLCDIGLPGMDGLAVAAQLREELQGALPVMVALTGYGQAEDRARSIAAGFGLHLTKPVNPESLLALIDRQVERLAGALH
ncbi:ATP-binding protein [Methylibium sp.]|uniref:hybrid sensor histidine kinase/response regulator n=1 Tax=Methylibium sp. TaxID=2067992 RepID=UPI0017F34335|nr:ATP-binding protein [Methylibium sp.]MBA3588568.1 response regulator [Methylibium sp.]